ncbi:MAG TPA: HAMP domain-containing sensor histidine kinase [Candidatus Limnocylindria bacterium]|nr:HAMP domain-containing sensor histidine kinase [Candidatus Limnocylindria bacterium]
MSFRLRVALLTAAAVAVAAIAAGAVMYVLVQQQLDTAFNDTLKTSAQTARLQGGPRPDVRFGHGGGTVRVEYLSGRADIFAQIVDSGGAIVGSDPQAGESPELVTREVLAVANGQRADAFADVTTAGGHFRVYAVPFTPGRALELARPLAEIDTALANLRLALIGLGVGAALLAALMGAVISRVVLAPVRRLSATVNEVTRTRDLSRRVAMTGHDEMARLAASFDGMLTALEISLRQQRQLVADASHELRTPLTSLRTNLELLARGQPTDPAERQQVLVELVGQMERLSTLVGDLIDLARDEEATLPIEPVRLDEVVAEAITDVRGRYPRVRFEAAIEETIVRGIRPRIARAVTNLLDNAGKWSPAGGVVEVSVKDGEVSVRDHGPGVAPEDAPRVFDRFWRAPNARSLPGSGLGLSIVKDVAESHGGSVTLEHANGGGARFRLRLATSP